MTNRPRRSITMLVAALVIFVSLGEVGAQTDASSSVQLQDDFFGLHMRWGATTTPWPFVHVGSWRVITAETEWRGLEPQRGQWLFSHLDSAVQRAAIHGADVLLSLGQTPTWASARPQEIVPNGPGASAEPANMADWENYIRVVVARYRGRIKYYELWNEPYFTEVFGVTGRGHFTGSAAVMAEMARIAKRVIKELDPSAKLVGPACVGSVECIEAFLKAGGGGHIDIIAFHFYVSPQLIPAKAQALQAIAKKYGVENLPIWNTESGYLVHGTDQPTNPQPKLGESFAYVLSQEQLPGAVLKAMVFAATSGIKRYYHFSWDIPTMHVMWKNGTEPTPASLGYAQTLRWLRGSRLSNLKTADGIVSCNVTSKSGHKGMLVWSVSGTRNYTIPTPFSLTGYETLSGSYIARNFATNVDAGELPILLRQETTLW